MKNESLYAAQMAWDGCLVVLDVSHFGRRSLPRFPGGEGLRMHSAFS